MFFICPILFLFIILCKIYINSLVILFMKIINCAQAIVLTIWTELSIICFIFLWVSLNAFCLVSKLEYRNYNRNNVWCKDFSNWYFMFYCNNHRMSFNAYCSRYNFIPLHPINPRIMHKQGSSSQYVISWIQLLWYQYMSIEQCFRYSIWLHSIKSYKEVNDFLPSK